MAINRRNFVKAAAFCGCGLFGRPAAAARREVVVGGRRARTIDMHTHVYVHEAWPLIKDRKEADHTLPALASGPMGINRQAIDERLTEMDRQGIDIHVVSLHPAQFNYWAEQALSTELVKIQNAMIAAFVAARPDRFIGLATVSLAYPELAVEQVSYAADKLGLKGVSIGGSVNGEELTAPRFEPFWKKAQDAGLLVFLHPAGIAAADSKRYEGAGYLVNTIGNPLETTIALSHMIFEGFLDRFPDLRILAAHGGGFLSSYIGRSDNCSDVRADCRKMKRKPSDYLKGPQLFFDALVYSPENIRHLVNTVGADRVVMGTDFAFDVSSKTPVDSILQTPGLTEAEQIAILGGNAEKLLKIKTA